MNMLRTIVFWIFVGPLYVGSAVVQWLARGFHPELTDAEWKDVQ